MANAWEHPAAIAAEGLMHLEDQLVISNLAARDKTNEFQQPGLKIGDNVKIRTNPEYEANEFTNNGTNTVAIQAIRNSKRNFQIEKLFDVSVEITAREKVLDLDSFAEEVLIPATYKLAEKCDIYVGTKILQASGNYISATLLASAADIALARKEANYQQLGRNRFVLLDTTIEAILLGQTWFNQSQTRGDPGIATLQSANMGRVMGMDFFASENFPTDVVAAPGDGSSITNNSSTTNLIGLSVLTIDALTLQIEAGDRIKVAGVRRPMLVSAQVVATATTIPLVDPITEIIPDNAAVTVISSNVAHTTRGAIFDGSSLAVAMPPLEAPSDKPSSVATNNGYSIRVVQGYDIKRKVEIMSLDLMIGATAWDPRHITLLSDQ